MPCSPAPVDRNIKHHAQWLHGLPFCEQKIYSYELMWSRTRGLKESFKNHMSLSLLDPTKQLMHPKSEMVHDSLHPT